MTDVRLVHTAGLEPGELGGLREMLDEAFEGQFSDEDFEHGLGGMHALVRRGGRIVAHGSVVQRRVVHGGRALRTGYVEAVAVRAADRGQGLGHAVMGALEEVIGRAYVLGALAASATGAPLYRSRGWTVWGGSLGALAPGGPVSLPEEGSTYLWVPPGGVLPDPAGPLWFDWRDGDVL
ncbi:GNAT family N-acetyltransferase [Streptomyces sp. NPDC048603]|uniref:GNAT family N-acetyltransferase n=1 Tax=Streptomyces sp. NPDC048603 TaxID=3365577 RepID=UPI0037176EAF